MKLNWGHYIVISFVLFVLMIGYMVVRSYQHTNDLVAEDYYAQEIKFQDVIDKKKNAASLPQDIKWESKDRGILITYPKMAGEIAGKIALERPSDKSKDQSFDIKIEAGNTQFLKNETFVHGKYLIKIDWTSGSKNYFTEGTAYIIQ